MKYQVPQFIEIEDKIFGPLTLKQFLYLAGGSALGFITWSLIPKPFGIIIGLPILLAFVALAFMKVNDRPMILAVENGIKYFFGSKLYIWKKTERKPEAKATEKKQDVADALDASIPKLSDSKLRELTWSLDINEQIKEAGGATGNVRNNKENFGL